MQNQTILQSFEWYTTDDGSFYRTMKDMVPSFSLLGLTAIWLPPACKAQNGIQDTGYGIYDLYDLGEFEQKGSVRTKYGTRQEYLELIQALHDHGLEVYCDVVLNQKMGADETEDVMVVDSASNNRNYDSSSQHMIKAWTKFTFPKRMGKYSSFIWDHTCFDGTDYDASTGKSAVYRFAGKAWDSAVDSENGNYDYLMGCDLDMSDPIVKEELLKWGKWYYDTTKFDGLRLDAVKHISSDFYGWWLHEMRNYTGRDFFAVGEYWNGDLARLHDYLKRSLLCMSLFDVPLHYKFYQASCSNGQRDMRKLFDDTLVGTMPEHAVTFVDNHDTQPSQALSSFVNSWFKPIAYAIILLMEKGIPCVFAGDLYGIPHDGIQPVKELPLLIRLRHNHAYGKETWYREQTDVIGFTRAGDEEHHATSLCIVLSDGPGGSLCMDAGKQFAGKTFVDVLDTCHEMVRIQEDGTAMFRCEGGSVSVWMEQEAAENLRK